MCLENILLQRLYNTRIFCWKQNSHSGIRERGETLDESLLRHFQIVPKRTDKFLEISVQRKKIKTYMYYKKFTFTELESRLDVHLLQCTSKVTQG